jgi:7-keto-8-aminopelargonate synthetase-like enzyme
VDEAHSTGVLGPQGRGLVSALGLEDKITIRLHTFGKAMACNGGKSFVRLLYALTMLLTRRYSYHSVQPADQALPD